ncbi:MAG: hypothetical protein QXJ75_05670 [Candidatus Bathyarchaeia archaeon]
MSSSIEFTIKARDEASAQINAVYEVMAKGKNVTAEVQAQFKEFRAELQAQQQAQRTLEQSWLRNHECLMKGAALMDNFATLGRQTTQMLTQYNTAAFRLERTQRDLADAQADVNRLEAAGLAHTAQYTQALTRLQDAQQRVNEATMYYQATVAGLVFQIPGFAQQVFNIVRAWENYKIAAGGAVTVTKLLSSAFVSSPWGWVALAIGAIVVALYAVTDGFKNWKSVIDAANQAIQWLLMPVKWLMDALAPFIPAAAEARRALEDFRIEAVGVALGLDRLVGGTAAATPTLADYAQNANLAAEATESLDKAAGEAARHLESLEEFVFREFTMASDQFRFDLEHSATSLQNLLASGTASAIAEANQLIEAFAERWSIGWDEARRVLTDRVSEMRREFTMAMEEMEAQASQSISAINQINDTIGKGEAKMREELLGRGFHEIKPGYYSQTPKSELVAQIRASMAQAEAAGMTESAAAYGAFLASIPAQYGFEGTVTRPTLFLAGEKGPEHVQITPMPSPPRTIRIENTIHIERVTVNDETDLNRLRRAVEQGILRALELQRGISA